MCVLPEKTQISSGSARVPIFSAHFPPFFPISEYGNHRVPLFRNLTGTLMEHALSCPTLYIFYVMLLNFEKKVCPKIESFSLLFSPKFET